jgi:hypothetical protein
MATAETQRQLHRQQQPQMLFISETTGNKNKNSTHVVLLESQQTQSDIHRQSICISCSLQSSKICTSLTINKLEVGVAQHYGKSTF